MCTQQRNSMKKLILTLIFMAVGAGFVSADFFEDLGQGGRTLTAVDAVYRQIISSRYTVDWGNFNGFLFDIKFNEGDFVDESETSYVGIATIKLTPATEQNSLCDGCNLVGGVEIAPYYVLNAPANGGNMTIVVMWGNAFVLTWYNTLVQVEMAKNIFNETIRDELGIPFPVTLHFDGRLPDYGVTGE